MRAWPLVAFAAVCGVLVVARPREVHANELSTSLDALSDLVEDGSTIVLNGQRLHVSSKTTDEPAGSILDRADAACDGVRARTATETLCVGTGVRRVTTSAAAGKTHVVTTSSDARIDLAPAGDAPGSDSRVAGRPTGSRRIVTAFVEGRPYAMRVYETTAPPRDAVRELASSLEAHAFTTARRTDEGATFYREGTDVIVFAAHDVDRTLVTVLEVGSR